MAPKPTNQFRTSPKFGSHRREEKAHRAQSTLPDRRNGRGIPTAIVWAIVISVAGWLCLDRGGDLDSNVAFARTPATDTLSASFSICGESRRTNCVVDGDTFWHQGQKIRIADIDTPELSPPRCEAERVKGEAAKARLLVLLKAGKFSLVAGIRDEDKYGRKLRTVSREGGKKPWGFGWVWGAGHSLIGRPVPKSATQTDSNKLVDVFPLPVLACVGERFRAIVESFEPGIHEFHPIQLKSSQGVPHEEPYFLINVRQRFDAILVKRDRS